ncbi:hypothetical protein IFM89_008899 [Coptis chinensis]|uniref:FAE domain-containing protein n=1 Tax=Coptis chinensis TaxID=261450 RepID=A0A835HWM4_9MAGN|nr:hypothetical protein IFM89_008899 [Coptis chinensis]
MEEARKEAKTVLFGAIDELLTKTRVKASDIGILVVNSSLFTPTPSPCSIIINHYNFRINVLSYNLGGMGCSAAPMFVDLANNLLKVHPNSYALVASTENITLNWYLGNNRSILVTNCLFRMGARDVLLSNRTSDHYRAKCQLMHIVRTHKGNDDHGYGSTYQEKDTSGIIGVSLSKELAKVSEGALKSNITMDKEPPTSALDVSVVDAPPKSTNEPTTSVQQRELDFINRVCEHKQRIIDHVLATLAKVLEKQGNEGHQVQSPPLQNELRL